MKKFFYNLGLKFQQFMVGRYGIDQLYKALMRIYLISILVTAVIGRFTSRTFYYIISFACLGIFIFALCRVFSKNIEKRRKENANWLTFTGKINKHFRILKDKWKFRKTHVFRKCPNCKAILRLKRQKGTHSLVCPHCNQSFKIKVLF